MHAPVSRLGTMMAAEVLAPDGRSAAQEPKILRAQTSRLNTIWSSLTAYVHLHTGGRRFEMH